MILSRSFLDLMIITTRYFRSQEIHLEISVNKYNRYVFGQFF